MTLLLQAYIQGFAPIPNLDVQVHLFGLENFVQAFIKYHFVT